MKLIHLEKNQKIPSLDIVTTQARPPPFKVISHRTTILTKARMRHCLDVAVPSCVCVYVTKIRKETDRATYFAGLTLDVNFEIVMVARPPSRASGSPTTILDAPW